MMQSLFEGLNFSPLNKVTFLFLLTDSTGLVIKQELSADHGQGQSPSTGFSTDIEGCRKVRHKCMVAVGLMKI